MSSEDGAVANRIKELSRAIDQLASASAEEITTAAWVERLVQVWSLVEDLDPELARRRAEYG